MYVSERFYVLVVLSCSHLVVVGGVSRSCSSPVALENADEGLLELLVGERVHERIYGRVEIAQIVARVVEVMIEARVETRRTVGGVYAHDVPRREAEYERGEYERDGAQRLARSILVLDLLLGLLHTSTTIRIIGLLLLVLLDLARDERVERCARLVCQQRQLVHHFVGLVEQQCVRFACFYGERCRCW